MNEWKKFFTFESASTAILSLSVLLVPIFFVPNSSLTFQFTKLIIISLAIILAFIFHIIYSLKSGRLILPTGAIFITAAIVPVVYLASALTSATPFLSLIGYGYEIETAMYTFLMMILFAMVAINFQEKKKIFYAYGLFFISFLLLALVHITRLFFGPEFITFGVLGAITSNTVGKWYDLGIFFSVGALMSLISLEMLKVKGFVRVLLYFGLVASLFILTIINFTIIWYVLALFALGFFIYRISFSGVHISLEGSVSNDGEHTKTKSARPVSVSSLVIIVLSLIFISPIGNPISESIANRFQVSNVEVRPSWSSTFAIAKESIKADPILGAGPNRFSSQWNLHKPDINLTDYWGIDFNYGIGLIPTALTDVGILGFLAWLAFIALVAYFGLRALFIRGSDNDSRYLILSSFFISFFLWVMAFIYVPSATVYFLTFFFTGLFVASLLREEIIHQKTITFLKYPRVGFVFVLGFVLLIIASLGLSYIVIEKAIASSYFQSGSLLANAGNIDDAEADVFKAINLNDEDVYYRAISELNIARINQIVASVSSATTVPEETKSRFQKVLGNAILAAQEALKKNNKDYQNWLAVARVYDAITPLGVQQAYETANNAYMEALKLNPKNPGIELALARLEVNHRDFVKAKDHIAKALALKDNYADAIFLLSQIEVNDGDIRGAISSVEKISTISPNAPGVFFQLGLLKYDAKDYSGAALAFERSIVLVPNYANAKYFLGLSYNKLGKNTDAIKQFEDLSFSNPDNKEVKFILDNLKAGKDPFAKVEPPLDNKPEKRKKLPVEEKI